MVEEYEAGIATTDTTEGLRKVLTVKEPGLYPTSQQKPALEHLELAFAIRTRKHKSTSKAKAKTEPVISERVKGYLEQLKTTRAHLPVAVKYLAADSFYSKQSVVDGVVALDLHLVSKLRIAESCWSGSPIRDKLRNEHSCQAGLSGWLKKECSFPTRSVGEGFNNQLLEWFADRFNNLQITNFGVLLKPNFYW